MSHIRYKLTKENIYLIIIYRAWILVSMIITISFFSVNACTASDYSSGITSFRNLIENDYSNFYSKDRLLRMGAAFMSMGVVANSNMDENFQDWYQENIRSENRDNYAKIAKSFGEKKYLIPISLITSGIYYFERDSDIGIWGFNTTRAFVVGLPAMFAMQNITGASRPNEFSGSEWNPFKDNNGVSGHAFSGAIPFLSIARMYNNKPVKYASYLASGLAAWSRVNDNDHYISQSILGWYMAYESVNSVFDTNKKRSNISFSPVIGNDFYGISICGRW